MCERDWILFWEKWKPQGGHISSQSDSISRGHGNAPAGRAALYQVKIDSRNPCPSQSTGFALVASLLLLGFPRAMPPILPLTTFLLCQFYHMALNFDREDPPPG